MSVLVIITYLYVFVSSFILIETKINKISIFTLKNPWKYFITIGIMSAIFNYFNFYAVSIAPNVGYVNAINASSISVVTIFSIILFKDEFSIRKIIGVIGVTGGLLLLLIK